MPNAVQIQPVPHAGKTRLSGNQKRTLFGVLLLLGWALVVVSRIGRGNDFVSFYAAGWLARTNPSHLYTLSSQFAAQRACGGTYPMPWLHPAPEAWLFAPLTYFSPFSAFAVWSAVSVAMFGVVLWLLRSEILALRPEAHYALIAFLYPPLMFGLHTGQDHVLFLLLWTLAYLSLREEKPVASGVFIGLSLIRYQFALPVLILLAAMRAWKTVLAASSVGAAIMGASFLIVGRNLIPSYIAALRVLAFYHDPIAVGSMPTLRGLLSHLPHSVLFLVIAEVALLVWAVVSVQRMTLPEGMLLAIMVASLADLHGYGYELVALALPAVALLRRTSHAAWILWCCFACFVLAAFSGDWECLVAVLVLFMVLMFQRSAPMLLEVES